MLKRYNLVLVNFLFLFILEVLFKLFVKGDLIKPELLNIFIFSLINSLVITFLVTLFNKLFNRILSIILNAFITLIFISQYIYFCYYKTIYSAYSFVKGGQVFEFFDSIKSVMMSKYLYVICLILPLLLFIIFNKKIEYKRYRIKPKLIVISLIFITYIGAYFSLNYYNTKELYSPQKLYYKVNNLALSVENFGVITGMRLDTQRLIFGFKEEFVAKKQKVVIKKKEYNVVTEINFDDLIANTTNKDVKSIHEYFKNVAPTEKNDYTGIFAGKNLIYIVAESFSPMAISEKYTPTLYKLYNEGFQFTNFYTPVFYVSTSDGEYTTLLSLLPQNGVWSMTRAKNNYLPYAYGNMFKSLGYTTKAYHDGYSTFYNRNLTHPNMGYTFKACGRGLYINCRVWAQSDIEMINKSTGEYVNAEHFMTYYLTISGHLRYNFYGNQMAMKNRKVVEDLNAITSIKAYIATQVEFDRAVEALINNLQAAGKLDDTVIAISADHYPYGLTDNDIKSYANYIDDFKFDVHRNAFILWNNKMEKKVTINKYASSLDILPTMLNMFGMKYDSRLLMGTDIMNNDDGLVIFNDNSWITAKGKYNARTKVFTPYKENIPDTYVDEINSTVYNKTLISRMMLRTNYYKHVFK